MKLKINEDGRLLIPIKVREELNLKGEVEAYIKDGCFIIHQPMNSTRTLIEERLSRKKISVSEKSFLKKLLKTID